MMVEGQKVEEEAGESKMKVNILQMEDNYAQIEFKDVNYCFSKIFTNKFIFT